MKQGLWSLRNFAAKDDNSFKIVAAGGNEMIIGAMMEHSKEKGAGEQGVLSLTPLTKIFNGEVAMSLLKKANAEAVVGEAIAVLSCSKPLIVQKR